MFSQQRLCQFEVHSWVFTEHMSSLPFVLKYHSPLLPRNRWVVGADEYPHGQNVDNCEAAGRACAGSLAGLFTFFPVYWKSGKVKEMEETRPEEAFVLFKSNQFVQQIHFFSTHVNSTYFLLNTQLLQNGVRHGFCPSGAHPAVRERPAFVTRCLIL